jgi:hypothetical protein
MPELKKLQPATDQRALPAILEQTGLRVDDFFRNVPNLIADEDITQQKVNSIGAVSATEHGKNNYLVLLHGNKNDAHLDEYRIDRKGNRVEQWIADKHDIISSQFFVTSGFALSCVHFSTALQSDSTFRYLGDERIDNQNTYVVAFAQLPGEATITVAMTGSQRKTVQMLVQGIAWVDKSSFQIVRLRTDLLAPRPEVGLDRQTTEVTFREVRFRYIASPLWQPRAVNVYATFYGQNFRNDIAMRKIDDIVPPPKCRPTVRNHNSRSPQPFCAGAPVDKVQRFIAN